MAALNKSYWPVDPLTGSRPVGYTKSGFTGNHVDPTAYDGFGCLLSPLRQQLPNGAWISTDGPNTDPIHLLASKRFGVAASNAAWGKLVDKVRSGPASLGVAAAEGREAFEMVENRLLQLYRGYRHLRKGEFRGFLRTFGVGPKRKHRNKIRNSVNEVSGLWLEYSFGWAPLTQDVYDALHTLEKPVPGGDMSGSGKEEWSYAAGTRKHFGVIHVKQGGFFFVENPNLYLMSQLGLANPAQIAWELVPFSFMVDWVFDVGSWLGGFTDFLGVGIRRGYTSRFVSTEGTIQWNFSSFGWGLYSQRIQCWIMKREPSLTRPVPNTSVLRNIGTSWKRAANAASLLGQILSKG